MASETWNRESAFDPGRLEDATLFVCLWFGCSVIGSSLLASVLPGDTVWTPGVYPLVFSGVVLAAAAVPLVVLLVARSRLYGQS